MESDTVRMQKAGWQFMMDRDIARMTIILAARYGSARTCIYFPEENVDMFFERDFIYKAANIPFGQEIHFQSNQPPSFKPVDMHQGFKHDVNFVYNTLKDVPNAYNMGEGGIIAPGFYKYALHEEFDKFFPEPTEVQEGAIQPQTNIKEVIKEVEKDYSVDELMSMVLDKQAPIQEEIKGKRRREKPKKEVTVAKVISIAR